MKGQYRLISLLLFLGAIGVRIAVAFVGSNSALTATFYLLLLMGALSIAFSCKKNDRYTNAFDFDNRLGLNVFSFLAGVGFFVDFISSALGIYYSAKEPHIALTSFVPLCLSCVLAILSSFYFILMSLSFGGSNYDFRKLRVFHFVPLFWTASKLLGVLDKAIDITDDNTNALKYLALILALGLFYLLATEIDNTDGAKRITVIALREFSFVGVLYFVSEMQMVVASHFSRSFDEVMLSICILMLSIFIYFFERNIIAHSKQEV